MWRGRALQGREGSQDLGVLWASAPCVILVVRDGAGSSKGVSGEALKFPFQAAEKHSQRGGMNWK